MDELYKYLISISPLQIETWNLIKELFVETSLKKGDYFIREGLTTKNIGFLKNGVIRAFYRDREGWEYNKHVFISNNLAGGHKEEREVNIVMLDADKRYLIFQNQFPNLEQLIPQTHK